MTFASVWSDKLEELGVRPSPVQVKADRPIESNPDAPIDAGGVPFWNRALIGWPLFDPSVVSVVQRTEAAGREVGTDVMNRVSGVGAGAARAVERIGTRLIILAVLVIAGMVVFNHILARRLQ